MGITPAEADHYSRLCDRLGFVWVTALVAVILLWFIAAAASSMPEFLAGCAIAIPGGIAYFLDRHYLRKLRP